MDRNRGEKKMEIVRKHILLVDDNQDFVELIRIRLEAAGFDV